MLRAFFKSRCFQHGACSGAAHNLCRARHIIVLTKGCGSRNEELMRPPLFPALALLAMIVSCPSLWAEPASRGGASSTNSGTADQESPRFQIIEQTEVDFGDRSVIYNRVAPPVLRERVRAPLPPAPTAEELAAMETEEPVAEQDFQVIFITAVVYDGIITELRWTENQREHRAFSNIDFHYLAGVEFQSGGTAYYLGVAVDDATRASVAEWNHEVEKLGWPREMKTNLTRSNDFPAGYSSYIAVPDESRALALAWNRYLTKTGAPPDEFLPVPDSPPAGADESPVMDAIHAWFDSNKSQLIPGYAARKAAAAERERWLQEHPPVPRDTVINYFPIRSSQNTVFPRGATK